MTETEQKDIHLTAEDDAQRLDIFLLSCLPGFSRTYVQKLIRNGLVRVNAAAAKPADRIRRNDRIRISLPPPAETNIRPEAIPLDVVYEDDHLIVINKPVGMNVHPVPHCISGTLVNAVLHHCDRLSGIGGTARPGIVHRLDKETSGLIVVAKTDAAHLSLAAQFHDHTITKWYTAVVYGSLKRDKVRVDLPIGRSPINRKKMAVVAKGGRQAVTEFQAAERFKYFTLLDVRTFTGRTHQIRVHAAHIGHPVAGDALYSGRKRIGSGLESGILQKALNVLKGHALHAKRLVFCHPITEKDMAFEAPLREDITRFIETIRSVGD
ncbi:MAG: RluA family pseudouridine synthase [bacterium]